MLKELVRLLIYLRVKIKLLSDSDFNKLLSECNSYEEGLYILCFRYC